MANRPRPFGMSADVARKIAAKYDRDEEIQAKNWIEDVLGQQLNEEFGRNQAMGQQEFHKVLKDGVILCKLAQAIIGPDAAKYKQKQMPFIQMENIGNFLRACEKYGVSKTDLFQTVDLYECQNMVQVINTIQALGRKAQAHGYQGPTLGPKEASKNVRDFDEETMNAGQTVIGLQMGTNKVASQSGMTMGKPRGIMGVHK